MLNYSTYVSKTKPVVLRAISFPILFNFNF